MNDDRQFDQTARRFLEPGPTQAPATPIRAALLTIQTTPQARDLGFRLPSPRFVVPLRLAMAAAIAIVALVGIGQVQLPRAYIGAGPSSSPTQSPAPTAVDTALWTTFTSERYGYAVRHPAVWEIAPATGFWTVEAWRASYGPGPVEDHMAGDLSNSRPCTYAELTCAYPAFSGWSAPLPAGMSELQFLGLWSAPNAPGSQQCFPTPEQLASINIGGQIGRLGASACGVIAVAFAFVGDRAYGFEMEDRVNYPDSPLFRAILSTVELHPEDALDPPNPEPSADPSESASPRESPAAS